VKVYSKISDLQTELIAAQKKGLKIGFVPTMGALHPGHISLVQQSQKQCDITVVSIFVNPTQFNNPDDLDKYPRTLDSDLKLLEDVGCHFVFTPSVEEIYPENHQEIQLDLGFLAKTMEGKFRPGHFDGVVNVVYRLFEIVKPNKAFFGLKDFQQVAVIKFMVEQLNVPIEIVACPTLRENEGLAMSSRNMRLSDQNKKEALVLYKTLEFAKSLKSSNKTPKEVQTLSIDYFNKSELELEYFEIVNPLTLESLQNEWVDDATACIVAYCDGVRLIDNLQL